jgi:hypothetical protein
VAHFCKRLLFQPEILALASVSFPFREEVLNQAAKWFQED